MANPIITVIRNKDLLTMPYKENAYYYCMDTETLWHDVSNSPVGGRKQLDVEVIPTELMRRNYSYSANLTYYYILETRSLYYYNNGWRLIVGSPQQRKSFNIDSKQYESLDTEENGNGLLGDGSVVIRDSNKMIKGRARINEDTNELEFSSFDGGGITFLPKGITGDSQLRLSRNNKMSYTGEFYTYGDMFVVSSGDNTEEYYSCPICGHSGVYNSTNFTGCEGTVKERTSVDSTEELCGNMDVDIISRKDIFKKITPSIFKCRNCGQKGSFIPSTFEGCPRCSSFDVEEEDRFIEYYLVKDKVLTEADDEIIKSYAQMTSTEIVSKLQQYNTGVIEGSDNFEIFEIVYDGTKSYNKKSDGINTILNVSYDDVYERYSMTGFSSILYSLNYPFNSITSDRYYGYAVFEITNGISCNSFTSIMVTTYIQNSGLAVDMHFVSLNYEGIYRQRYTKIGGNGEDQVISIDLDEHRDTFRDKFIKYIIIGSLTPSPVEIDLVEVKCINAIESVVIPIDVDKLDGHDSSYFAKNYHFHDLDDIRLVKSRYDSTIYDDNNNIIHEINDVKEFYGNYNSIDFARDIIEKSLVNNKSNIAEETGLTFVKTQGVSRIDSPELGGYPYTFDTYKLQPRTFTISYKDNNTSYSMGDVTISSLKSATANLKIDPLGHEHNYQQINNLSYVRDASGNAIYPSLSFFNQSDLSLTSNKSLIEVLDNSLNKLNTESVKWSDTTRDANNTSEKAGKIPILNSESKLSDTALYSDSLSSRITIQLNGGVTSDEFHIQNSGDNITVTTVVDPNKHDHEQYSQLIQIGKPDTTDSVIKNIGESERSFQFRKMRQKGIAPLDSSGKVPFEYLPDSLYGALQYQGLFDPTNGIPTIESNDVRLSSVRIGINTVSDTSMYESDIIVTLNSLNITFDNGTTSNYSLISSLYSNACTSTLGTNKCTFKITDSNPEGFCKFLISENDYIDLTNITSCSLNYTIQSDNEVIPPISIILMSSSDTKIKSTFSVSKGTFNYSISNASNIEYMKGMYWIANSQGNLSGVKKQDGTISSLSNPQEFLVGDWLIYNGNEFEYLDNSGSVESVNGMQGAITLDFESMGSISSDLLDLYSPTITRYDSNTLGDHVKILTTHKSSRDYYANTELTDDDGNTYYGESYKLEISTDYFRGDLIGTADRSIKSQSFEIPYQIIFDSDDIASEEIYKIGEEDNYGSTIKLSIKDLISRSDLDTIEQSNYSHSIVDGNDVLYYKIPRLNKEGVIPYNLSNKLIDDGIIGVTAIIKNNRIE